MSTNEKSVEQLKEELKAQAESLAFVRRHTGRGTPMNYNNCDANNALMMRHVLDSKREWNQDSLEIAFYELTQAGRLAPPDGPVETLSDPAAPAPEPEKTPWPSFSTIAEVKAMDPTIYKQFYYSAKHSAAFRAAVNVVLAGGK